MEVSNVPCDVVEKLIVVFKKITESHFKIADDSYLEKLQTNIRSELDKNGCKHLQSQLFTKCFENTIEIWSKTPPDPSVAGFVIRFVGAFTRNEDEFGFVQKSRIIDGLLHCLDMEVFGSSPLKVSYITLLSDVIGHDSGFTWVKTTKLWKNVIKFCFSNSNVYVEREAGKFLIKFLEKIKRSDEILEEILREVLLPLIACSTLMPVDGMDADAAAVFEEKLQKKISPSLRLLAIILEFCLTSRSPNSIPCLLLHTFEIEPVLKSLLETCEGENLLEMVAAAYAMLLLVTLDCKDSSAAVFVTQIPQGVMEIFKVLAKRHKIANMIKLAKLCQILWCKLNANAGASSNPLQSGLETNFILIQLMPALMFIKKTTQMNSFLDLFVNKLFDLSTESTQRLAYLVRDELTDMTPTDTAFKGVLSVTKNIDTLTLEQAVLIFQALAYLLKGFVPRGCDEDDPITDEQFELEQTFCVTRAPLLSAILSALSMLIEKFKINWRESLESLCLLKFTSILLKNPHLSPLLAVQCLLLIKLSILNFMSPNLALLTNKIEGSSLECLVPLLYKRLHDPNWEIRDSCIEVVTVMAELADAKYPVFQETLLETNFCNLMVAIVEGDTESYVRASALRALTAMVKINKIWNQYLNGLDIVSKVMNILRNESEGIVRREAALLIKEIYEHQHCRPEVLETLYRIMAYSSTYDLHWEVKVNSLLFWEKVIQRSLVDQGMIDGFFPSVTFSKENKKIVTLTSDEIKSRLKKVLNELSNVGCLHVLLTTLNDDCDLQVVQKSAQIIKDFLNVLTRYNIIQTSYYGDSFGDKNSVKRKTSDEGCCEKRKPIGKSPYIPCNLQKHNVDSNDDDIGAKSDKVIEDIVNEMDINLLVSVCNPGQENVKGNSGLSLTTVKPEIFLSRMERFDLNQFLNEKRRWLADSSDDLSVLLNDILTMHSECETNILDCY